MKDGKIPPGFITICITDPITGIWLSRNKIKRQKIKDKRQKIEVLRIEEMGGIMGSG